MLTEARANMLRASWPCLPALDQICINLCLPLHVQEPVLPAPPDFATTGFHTGDAAPALPGYPSSSYLFGSAASGNAGHNPTGQQHQQQQSQQPQQQQPQQAATQQAQGSEALNAVHLQYYQMQRAQVRWLFCGLLTKPTGSLWLPTAACTSSQLPGPACTGFTAFR